MPSPVLLAVAFCFAALTLVTLIASPRQRNLLLARLHIQRRTRSFETTSPSSISPAKEAKQANSIGPASEFCNLLPPSGREALARLYRSLPSSFQVESQEQFTNTIDDSARRPVPLDTPADELTGDEITPTGFSVAEINELGDFPDYAALSGVPLPSPYREFDINKALARPYRPFRWPYHQTMSLMKLEPDWWLELENTYRPRMKQRQDIYENHSKLVFQHMPGSEMACKEVMEMALQFLCARYPQYFSLTSDKTVFKNEILGTRTDLKSTHPLHVLRQNVPEDFAVMIRNPEDGLYYLRAAMICSAIGWNADVKMGKPLHGVHEPVPEYKEKMEFSMNRFFAKMPTDKPIQRGSWGFEIDEPLFMAPDDPLEAYRNHRLPGLALSRCHLRVDWQTLRRLPLTGAIAFNFKALFTPVEEFRDEPFVPALCLKVLSEGNDGILKYKSALHTEHVVKPALEEWKKEQVERGLVPEGWEEQTMDESPFYPRWEEKWHRQQGF